MAAVCNTKTTQNYEWVLAFPLAILERVHALPGGVLPYMGYIGMCSCEGYGFQAVYSRIG